MKRVLLVLWKSDRLLKIHCVVYEGDDNQYHYDLAVDLRNGDLIECIYNLLYILIAVIIALCLVKCIRIILIQHMFTTGTALNVLCITYYSTSINIIGVLTSYNFT